MTHRFLVIYIFCFFQQVYSQNNFDVKLINEKALPKGILFEGKFLDAVRWTDSIGDNIVIRTQTGIHINKKFDHENDGRDAEIFAYRYLVEEGNVKLLWKVYDFIKDCPVDVEAEFFKDTFPVTDLDNDGIAEVWLMYKKVCHGDVSPYDMKIIMYEDSQKYAMRGENKVFGGTDEKGKKHYIGGDYTFDSAFDEGPGVFLAYAKQLWQKNIMQKWD